MTLEARKVLNKASAGMTHYLKTHPADIQRLSTFRQLVLDIPTFGILELPTLPILVETATALSMQHGLLSSDALIVATMRHHGLTHLASHDADFDRVPGIARYGPI